MQFNEKNPLSEKEQAKLHSFSCISCYLGIIIFISFRSTFTREEKQKSLSCSVPVPHPAPRTGSRGSHIPVSSPAELKALYWNTGHMKSISPVHLPRSLSLQRRISQKLYQSSFFHIILCLKQEFSPPRVTKPGVSLFLVVA